MGTKIESGHIYRMPFGNISILATKAGISSIELLTSSKPGGKPRAGTQDERADSIASLGPSALTNRCAEEILEYLSAKRSVFDVPLDVEGTDFQMRVWDAIQEIPYSQTRTVKQLAEMIGSPSSYRSVGVAERQNPVPILIPAHRVISSSTFTSSHCNDGLRAAFRELEARSS